MRCDQRQILTLGAFPFCFFCFVPAVLFTLVLVPLDCLVGVVARFPLPFERGF